MDTATQPLRTWEKWGLWALLALIVVFGVITEKRSAFMSRRMGDIGCFFRAGWAAREGINIYDVMCDNTWHYNYPPFFAILMGPLGDPVAGADRTGYLPFPVSVAIFYILNVASLVLGMHWLASAFEKVYFPDQPRYCRRWWGLRILPILVCLYPIGHTMGRGQVNLMVFAMLAAGMAWVARGRSFRGGQWFAVAACVKVVPIYLLVYPIWKRDVRAVLGIGFGLFLTLWLIPRIYFGGGLLERQYATFYTEFLGPSLHIPTEHGATRANEILAAGSTESIGVKNALQNWIHFGREVPHEFHPAAKLGYVALGFLMTLATLWPRGRDDHRAEFLHGFSLVILLMTLFAPVCHVHYLVFCIPVLMSNLVRWWAERSDVGLSWPILATHWAFLFTTFATAVPNRDLFEHYCMPLLPMLAMWTMGVVALWRGKQSASESNAEPMVERLAA